MVPSRALLKDVLLALAVFRMVAEDSVIQDLATLEPRRLPMSPIVIWDATGIATAESYATVQLITNYYYDFLLLGRQHDEASMIYTTITMGAAALEKMEDGEWKGKIVKKSPWNSKFFVQFILRNSVSILRYTKNLRNATENFCATQFWNSVTQKICVTRRRILPSRCFKIALRKNICRNAILKQRYGKIFCRNAVLKQRYDKKSSALNKSGRWENNLRWENK